MLCRSSGADTDVDESFDGTSHAGDQSFSGGLSTTDFEGASMEASQAFCGPQLHFPHRRKASRAHLGCLETLRAARHIALHLSEDSLQCGQLQCAAAGCRTSRR